MTLLTVTKASAVAPRRIGVVHSTHLDDAALQCLIQALASQGWSEQSAAHPVVFEYAEAGGQYGGTHGDQIVRTLMRGHAGVDLIVSTGGVVSQRSALHEFPNGPKPFIYLSGRVPTPPQTASSTGNGAFCGVILNTSGQYAAAVAQMTSTGVNAGGIWLVQNYNSSMTADEYDEWPTLIPNNRNRFRFFEPQPPHLDSVDNHEESFAAEAQRLSAQVPAPTGLVISSDPFFRLKAAKFKSALKAVLPNIPICFPFADFSPSGNDFRLPSGATLFNAANTSDPSTAYYNLGLQAVAVLNASSPGNPIPPNSVQSLKWNSATMHWDPF